MAFDEYVLAVNRPQRTFTVGGRITEQLVSSLTRLELTNERNLILFVFSEAVYCNLVKLETSCTVVLPPTVSVLCPPPLKKVY